MAMLRYILFWIIALASLSGAAFGFWEVLAHQMDSHHYLDYHRAE